MESTWQRRRLLQVPEFAIYMRLPLYLRFMGSLLAGIIVICASAITLPRLAQPSPNPFAAYVHLSARYSPELEFWSSYETLTLAGLELACTTSPIEKYCVYQTEFGPFAIIQFNDLNDEGESGISFIAGDHALSIGDAALLWGRPIIVRQEKSLLLDWPSQRMSAVIHSDNGRFNYFLPVSSLLLGGSR
jgi:hypothetical protein